MQIITSSVRSKQAPASYYNSYKTNPIADHPHQTVYMLDLCTKKIVSDIRSATNVVSVRHLNKKKIHTLLNIILVSNNNKSTISFSLY